MTIAEKYAAQYLPNGEVSLVELIQAAVDEATNHATLRLIAVNREVVELQERIRQLEQERDELRKDAARYQFIRALENDAVAVQLVKSECDVDLDDAIDAAIAQGKVCGDERACVNCYTGIGECIAQGKGE